MAGQTVGNWRAPDDQTYDVNVRLSPDARNAPADLERLPFTSTAIGSNADGSTRIVRLNQVASVSLTTGPNQINRRDLVREVAINANVYNRSAGEVSSEVKAALDNMQSAFLMSEIKKHRFLVYFVILYHNENQSQLR